MKNLLIAFLILPALVFGQGKRYLLEVHNVFSPADSAGPYVLPIATGSVLGGIKVGSGLSIDPVTGVLDAAGTYVLPIASAGTLGGIKVGSGLSISPVTGVLSVSGGSGWGLTGNSGTTAGTNYVGTSDAVDLVFKTSGAEVGRFLSTGYFGVNGTPTSPIYVKGYDLGLPTLGSEILTDPSWTSTGWTGTWSTGFTHTTGNTSALSKAVTTTSGVSYLLVITVTGRTAGTFNFSVNGFSGNTNSASLQLGFTATFTGTTFTFTPTSTFDGTLTLSLKTVTGVSVPIGNFVNSNASGSVQFRTNDISNVGIGSTALGKIVPSTTSISASFSGTYGTGNTGVGGNALAASVNGNGNTAVGYNALSAFTSNGVTAVGYKALASLTTGLLNTAFGYEAMPTTTTGASNTAVGYRSLYSVAGGSSNIGIGTQALIGVTSGSDNVGIGISSQFAANGSENIGIGNVTLQKTTSGSYNIGIGKSAGSVTTTGNFNVAIGGASTLGGAAQGASWSGGSTQINNTSVGNSALYELFTGGNNVAIGFNAALHSTDFSGITAVGSNAGLYLGEGNNNTFIGYGTGSPTWVPDLSLEKTFAAADFSSSIVTFATPHGWGSVGTRRLVKYTQGTVNNAPMVDGTMLIAEVLSTTTAKIYFFTQTYGGPLSGTGMKFTPQYQYTNSTALGYNAALTASNQIVLGNSSVTQVVTAGTLLSKFGVKAGGPTTTDIPDGYTAVYKDSSSGNIYLYANIGGTLYKVQLL